MSIATTIIAPIAFRQFALGYFNKQQVIAASAKAAKVKKK